MLLKIEKLCSSDLERIRLIGDFLVECFRDYSPGWIPDSKAAVIEIQESFEDGRVSLVALDENERVLGWIAAIKNKNVWEIHPLAVNPTFQKQGIGTKLVENVCHLARESGAVSIWMGTGDETNSTNLSKPDAYENPISSLVSFSAEPGHPSHFWLRSGFRLVGFLPDAEGFGKPSVFFSKRLINQ